MEKLFHDVYTEERDKVTLGVHCLGLSASMWWFRHKEYHFTENMPKPTWAQFKVALYHRYLKDTTKETLERDLETIHQGDRTVREYEEEFSRIADLIPHVVQEERRKVRLLTQGLRPEIRRQLSSHRIVDYNDCIERCLSIEADVVISYAERAAAEKGKDDILNAMAQTKFSATLVHRDACHIVKCTVFYEPRIYTSTKSRKQICYLIGFVELDVVAAGETTPAGTLACSAVAKRRNRWLKRQTKKMVLDCRRW